MRQREAKMREWQKEWGWERRREEAERGERDRDRWTLVITWWFMTERSSRSPLISHRNSSFFIYFFIFPPMSEQGQCVCMCMCVCPGADHLHTPHFCWVASLSLRYDHSGHVFHCQYKSSLFLSLPSSLPLRLSHLTLSLRFNFFFPSLFLPFHILLVYLSLLTPAKPTLLWQLLFAECSNMNMMHGGLSGSNRIFWDLITDLLSARDS